MASRKVLGLGIPLLVCTILLGSSIGIAAAYSINSLPPIKLSIFEQTYGESEFTIAFTKTQLKKNSVTIKVQVTNNGDSTHSANITVSCHDADDNLLQDVAQLTGNVGAGQHVDLTYNFDSVSREDFSYCEATVEDLT